MKKLMAILTAIGIMIVSVAPANAWYRGGYYGGYGYGGGYGAALGIGLGLGVLGAIAGGGYGYGGYGYYGGYYPYGGYYNCVPRPIYNAWGQTVGYAAC